MTLHVHILPETPSAPPIWACAELRLINPLNHPSVKDRLNASYSLNGSLPQGRLDAVLIQRGGWPGLTLSKAQELLGAIRTRGAKLIYDIDDDLLCAHPIKAIDSVLEAVRPVIRFLAHEADLIICSTEPLADRMVACPAPKRVWRNAIDERLFGKPALAQVRQGNHQTVGYAGTPSHLRDLLSVTESLRSALTEQADRAKLDLIGTADAAHLKSLFGRLLTNAPRPATDYRSYLQTMQTKVRWDAAIAPLLDCEFNTSKSDIKFLEYAAFGIPGVFSASPAYESVIDGELGVLSQHIEFGRAILDLLEAPVRRRIIAQNAYEYVMHERTLATRSRELVSIIEAAL